jgi:hypothetical protein
MPDFQVEILSEAIEGDTVWAELFFHGTQTDGGKRMMRGVNIMRFQSGKIAWGKRIRIPCRHQAERRLLVRRTII